MSYNQVEIYVRSSPLGEVGIHWRNISKPEQPKEEPVVLKQRVIARDDGKQVTINSLINDTKPSLILARYENKVLVEVTGLDAAEDRSKRMGRRISEVVLWVGDATPEIESQLRKLAACILLSFWEKESTFLSKIRSAIDFDGLNDFKANAQQIQQLYTDAGTHLDDFLSKISPSVVELGESVWLTPKTIDIESQLYTLVKQISQTSFGETEQPVVVVAEFKKEGDTPPLRVSVGAASGIGEGLSVKPPAYPQQIVYKGNVWKAPETKTEKKTPVPSPEAVPSAQPILPQKAVPRRTTRIVIVGMILLILILLTTWVIAQPKILPPTPTLTPTPIPKHKPSSKTTNPQSFLQPANSPVLPDDNQPQSSQSRSPDA
ncbi:hypothetical protein [Brasilonema octagenarum]|uniref:Uncharacterized protein n=1 Tax=Brasilonema octagenarum UFV-OR1 TaxID=417115 RepID=A0ABX1M7K2_9CYAN|nr:hypothetical protein [Brasilonema octagenarum]NMF62939.1 hypothetical protein [Brasilonema octagenarum UFV-OR1]